jgi:hemerythrin-like domain-containing protein
MVALVQTATVTLNPAFLQEIKEDNQQLRDLFADVRRAFGHPRPDGPTRQYLLETLENFRDQLATHFALEEAFGYFDDPVDAAPRLSEQAESLRSEHGELFMIICAMVEDAYDLLRGAYNAAEFQELAHRFVRFEDAFSDHEARENALIMEAFNADIGVGD